MELRVLGPIEIVADGRPVRLAAFKHRQLLAALAINQRRPCSVDALIDALWGEAPPPSAAKLLRIYVSQLRKVLPAAARLHTRAAGYELELEAGTLDAARFERLLDEGRAAARSGNPALAASLLRRALALWRGPAFGELVYESFARAEAERLEELRLIALEERIEAELALGRHADVLPEVSRLADEQPFRERLQGQAMLSLYRCGRQSEALERYAAARARLNDELGLEPGAGLRELQRRILRHDPALAGAPVTDAPANVLPTPPNRLLGRTRELEEVRTLLLSDDVRLIVLTGAGGSGKTRVALEAAHQARESFANGAAFVSLAPLRDSDLVTAAVARALRIEEAPGETLFDTVATALRSLELLLVVDNAEHLRGAGPLLVELLAAAPRLTMLVTSRVVLHVTGEHVYPIEPLEPEPAEQLFIERARASEPRFRAGEASSTAIRRICARLDGLPLAIELAAGHVRTLSPSRLLERLESSLPLLTGPRDLPARQQTLRSTLEWSLDLLHPDEQRDLARLAVFSGGFDLEIAERICGTPVERLASLVDASLVRRIDTVGEARFSLLETVREHALGLLGSGRAELDRRHALHFLERAERADAQLYGAEHSSAVERLDADHDNFEAALDWLHRSAESVDELRLAAALWHHWSARGHPTEARRRLADALAAPSGRHHPARVKALHGAATLAARQGDLPAAERLGLETKSLAREVGDARGEAQGLNVLGIAAHVRGDLAAAGEHFGVAAELFRHAGDRRGYAIALLNLGVVELERGRFAASERFGDRALKIFRVLEDTSDQALIFGNLGLAAVGRGAPERAEQYFRESLRLAVDVRFTERIANALVGLAAVAASRGENARAASRLGAAATFRDDAGYVPERPEAALQERTEASIRSALGRARYEALVDDGRSRPWEVVAQA